MNTPSLSQVVQDRLLKAAREARKHAYAPYSKFLVGAAVLDEKGRIHAGCNVENAAYPQGVCAEAGALSAMALAGGRKARAVAVVGAGAKWVTPCGGSRTPTTEPPAGPRSGRSMSRAGGRGTARPPHADRNGPDR